MLDYQSVPMSWIRNGLPLDLKKLPKKNEKSYTPQNIGYKVITPPPKRKNMKV